MIETFPIESREAWLELRRNDITASDVAIVCGEGAYGSMAELYAEKKGLRPPLIDTGVLKRGRWGEAAVFEALQDERPEWEIRRAKIYMRDPQLRLGCTPDGYAIAPDHDGIGVVQAKVVARRTFCDRWLVNPEDSIKDGEAYPPQYYILQTLTEEMLSETRWGVLAVVINTEFDWYFRLFEVERDPVAEARIIKNVADFWTKYLDANIMPPFEPQRDAELIKRLYPKDDGSEIDLSDDNMAPILAEEYRELKAGMKRSKDRTDQIKTELLGKIGEHTYAKLRGGLRISTKQINKKSFVVPASSYRDFRIITPKGSSHE